jgi:hypothetical protein
MRDSGWALHGEPTPPEITVEFTGPLRQLVRVATERPPIIVTVDQVLDTVQTIELRSSALALGAGMEDIRAGAVRPATVVLRFDRVRTRVVPLTIGIIGTPPPGWEMAGPVTLEPPTVRVTGAGYLLEQLDTVRLAPVELTQRVGTDTLTLPIEDIPPEIAVNPAEVRVIIPLRAVAPDTTSVPAAGGPDEERRPRP